LITVIATAVVVAIAIDAGTIWTYTIHDTTISVLAMFTLLPSWLSLLFANTQVTNTHAAHQSSTHFYSPIVVVVRC